MREQDLELKGLCALAAELDRGVEASAALGHKVGEAVKVALVYEHDAGVVAELHYLLNVKVVVARADEAFKIGGRGGLSGAAHRFVVGLVPPRVNTFLLLRAYFLPLALWYRSEPAEFVRTKSK